MALKRNNIIAKFQESFLKDENIFAAWLSGSDARGTADDASAVEINFISSYTPQEIAVLTRRTLGELGTVDFFYADKRSVPTRMMGEIQDEKRYFIDFKAFGKDFKKKYQSRSDADKVSILFDRGGFVEKDDVDGKEFNESVRAEISFTKATYSHLTKRVIAVLERGDFAGAADAFRNEILSRLVFVLRVACKRSAAKLGFRRLRETLPKRLTDKIDSLSRFADEKALKENVATAEKMFSRLFSK